MLLYEAGISSHVIFFNYMENIEMELLLHDFVI